MKYKIFAYCGVFSSMEDLRAALTGYILFAGDAPRVVDASWLTLLQFHPIDWGEWVVVSYLNRPTTHPREFWQELIKLDPVVSMIAATPGEEIIHRGTDEARKYMTIGFNSVAVRGLAVGFTFEQLKGELL